MKFLKKFRAALLTTPFVALLLFMPMHSFAQSINFDMGQGPTTTAKLIQLVMLITVISLAPSILVMVTSFTRIVVVLAFLRTAMGLQTTPPNVVIHQPCPVSHALCYAADF